MRGLVYQKFVTQGGNWDHLVARELGSKYGQFTRPYTPTGALQYLIYRATNAQPIYYSPS